MCPLQVYKQKLSRVGARQFFSAAAVPNVRPLTKFRFSRRADYRGGIASLL